MPESYLDQELKVDYHGPQARLAYLCSLEGLKVAIPYPKQGRLEHLLNCDQPREQEADLAALYHKLTHLDCLDLH